MFAGMLAQVTRGPGRSGHNLATGAKDRHARPRLLHEASTASLQQTALRFRFPPSSGDGAPLIHTFYPHLSLALPSFELNAQTESPYALMVETGKPYGAQGIGKGREPNGSIRRGDGQSGDWPERG